MQFKKAMTEEGLLRFLLGSMDEVKDHPDRERYCTDFDKTYKWRKERYKELTGKEWTG